MNKERILYLDVLRWIATIAVIMLHVSGNFLVEYNSSVGWYSSVVYSSFTRWCVPIFVMISGALFLNEDTKLSIKTLYSKNILRMVVALVVWQLLYSFALSPCADYVHAWKEQVDYNYNASPLYPLMYHLWFLSLIIGLYVMVPVLRSIAEGKYAVYFMIVSFLINSFHWLTTLHLPHIGLINTLFQETYLTSFIGYSGYYVFGWYASTMSLSARHYRNARILFWTSALITIIGMAIFRDVAILDYMAPNVILMSGALFLCIRYRFSQSVNERWSTALFYSRSELFGIYLVHAFYVALFCVIYNIQTINCWPIVIIPVASILIFLASWGTIKIVRKLPFVKYIC